MTPRASRIFGLLIFLSGMGNVFSGVQKQMASFGAVLEILTGVLLALFGLRLLGRGNESQ
jgi:threonine/homoserine/homoserine lactone efflux protein